MKVCMAENQPYETGTGLVNKDFFFFSQTNV